MSVVKKDALILLFRYHHFLTKMSNKKFLHRNTRPIQAGKNGITTAQLRSENISSDLRQRVGVNLKMVQLGNSNGEIQLITDLRKTINKLQGRPGGGVPVRAVHGAAGGCASTRPAPTSTTQPTPA